MEKFRQELIQKSIQDFTIPAKKKIGPVISLTIHQEEEKKTTQNIYSWIQ